MACPGGTIFVYLWLTQDRLRWIPHGLYQCGAELHFILQPPCGRQQWYRHRFCHLSDWPDDGGFLQLGVGLAWSQVANLRRVFWDLCRRHCDIGRPYDSGVHWRPLPSLIFLDNRHSCGSNVPDRNRPTSVSWYSGRNVQHTLLLGEYNCSTRIPFTHNELQGSIIATSVVYGSQKRWGADGNILAWRLSLWLQMICPGIVAVFIWLCPESPRYLMAKDQPEKARKVLAALHANGDSNHPLVELEMAEMRRAVLETGLMSWRTYFDIRDLFKTSARRYRMMLNMTFAWFGQFSGNK